MRRQHPRYRNSGVEWLGSVPVHWEVKRLKNICNMQAGNGITAESIEPSGEYPVFGGNGLRGYTFQYTHEGDFILIGRQGALCGNVFIAKGRFWASEHAVVTTLDSPHIIGWFAAALTAMNLNQYSVSAAQPGLSVERVLTLLIPLPPLDEQRAIAAFLDRETKRIDKLVAKYRLLIQRLAEYRTALIARTVSQGLPPEDARAAGFNPLPRLKPSGVEWLGYVPEDWEIKRLKIVASINDDKLSDNEDPLREMSYVDIGSIHPIDGITTAEQMVFEDAPSRARRLVRDGDTIVSTVRTYLRAIAPISKPFDDMVVSTGFAVVRPRKLDHGYCSWALREYGFVEEIVACSTGVSYPAINASEMGYFPLPIPPLDEQRAIVAFLDRETGRIDSLSRRVETAIERLQEYRASLITAAVTGKIDVREPVYEEAV